MRSSISRCARGRLEFDDRWPTAVWEIVELAGEPIGRLLIERKPGSATVLRIALSRGRQGEGVGTSVLELMVARADEDRSDLTLLVGDDRRALRFYQLHGFDEVQVVDDLMLLRRRFRNGPRPR